MATRKRRIKPSSVVGDNYIQDWMWRLRCTKCGCRGDQHKASTGTCPATYGYGNDKPFPSFKHAGESEEEDRKLDEALERYWSSPDVFTPEDETAYTPGVGYHRRKR